MWKGRQWNQNTLRRDTGRSETKTFIYSLLLVIWQFYFEQKSWDTLFMESHISTEFQKIVRAFPRTVTIFNPRQWCIVIQHTQAAAHTDPVFPPSAVTSDISRTSHVTHVLISYCRRPWHGMMSQVSPDLLTPHSIPGSGHQPVARQARL